MLIQEYIKKSIDNGIIAWNSVKFAYPNGINLLYQFAIWKTVQALKKEYWEKNYKDFLTKEDLEKINKSELLLIAFLESWINLKEITKIYHNSRKRWVQII